MNKKQEIIVTENNTLLNYLIIIKKDIKRKDLKNYLKYNMISVNNKIITNANYQIKPQDKITISYSKKIIPEYNLKILYEDKDLIAISKPSGLLSISNTKEKDITAFKLVREYIKKENPHTYLFTIHRLDQDTSGVLIFGKSKKIKELLQSNWNNIVKKRGYYAIIENKIIPNTGTIKSYLKENKNGLIYSTKDNTGKYAITNYKTIKSNNNYSLLDINIETGRRNQIRVHLKEHNHPILGDKKYNSKNNPLNRLALHAYELSFIDPRTNKLLTIKDNIPEEFNNILK